MNKLMNRVNRVSKLFQPIRAIQKDEKIKDDLAKSYRLMLDMGIIRQTNRGMYTLLPLGYRALEKLITIVDCEMSNIGAQKILLPNLTNAKLWAKTGRLESMGPELFILEDRHEAKYILSPTYEESITNMIASVGPMQKNQMPMLLYQISNKWRDEMKPRHGLFRGREFIMKDLYSFDATVENAQQTYEAVHDAYKNIFDAIGVPYTVATGDTGLMGGTMSHEYHYLASIGEDTVLSCQSCRIYTNSTLNEQSICTNCQKAMKHNPAIEVGHTFLLGTKYSEVLNATWHTNNSKIPLVMGCYGLGLTRIMAAAVEILSTNDDLRWPRSIAPYTVCVIIPKENSKQFSAMPHAEKIIEMLSEKNIDFLIDDRIQMSIGRRMIDAKRTGYLYLIVIGKAAMSPEPLFELHDIHASSQSNLSFEGLLDFFRSTDQKERTRATA